MSDPSLQNIKDTKEINSIFTAVRAVGSLCLVLRIKYGTTHMERLVAPNIRINTKNRLHENIHNVYFKITKPWEERRTGWLFSSIIKLIHEWSFRSFCLQNWWINEWDCTKTPQWSEKKSIRRNNYSNFITKVLWYLYLPCNYYDVWQKIR